MGLRLLLVDSCSCRGAVVVSVTKSLLLLLSGHRILCHIDCTTILMLIYDRCCCGVRLSRQSCKSAICWLCDFGSTLLLQILLLVLTEHESLIVGTTIAFHDAILLFFSLLLEHLLILVEALCQCPGWIRKRLSLWGRWDLLSVLQVYHLLLLLPVRIGRQEGLFILDPFIVLHFVLLDKTLQVVHEGSVIPLHTCSRRRCFNCWGRLLRLFVNVRAGCAI